MRKARFFYVHLMLLVVLLNELCIHDGAAAGQTKENKTEPEIRVALTDSDFQSVYHDSCMEKTASDTCRRHEYAGDLCCVYGLHLRQRSAVVYL